MAPMPAQQESSAMFTLQTSHRTARKMTALDLSMFVIITRDEAGGWRHADREWTDTISKAETAVDIGTNPNAWFRVDRVIEMNAAEGWSKDVSVEIAEMILATFTSSELSHAAVCFIDEHCGAGAHELCLREVA
jgi:hypothetical protein